MASEQAQNVLAVKMDARRLARLFPYSHTRTYIYLHIIIITTSSNVISRDDQPYVPPTKPYELSALAADLVSLARYLLKPGGRLVFFLPTVRDEYKELDLDSMLCDGMEVIANSLQDFGAWGRRVRRRTASIHHMVVPDWILLFSVDYDSQSDVRVISASDVQITNGGRDDSCSRSP
jgi:hypothetical protein